jgi:hypothetical protein
MEFLVGTVYIERADVSLANSQFKPLLVAETDLDNAFSIGSR